MSVLNTRMLSTLIARNLDRNYGRLGVSTNRMSSGLRINLSLIHISEPTRRTQ